MLNSDPAPIDETDGTHDAAVNAVLRTGAPGALALAGIADGSRRGTLVRVLFPRVRTARGCAMTEQVNPADPDDGAERSERVERHWAAVATALMALLVVMAVFAGVHQATLPQSHVETADPRTLHLHGEFIESNLGSALEPDGSVTVRAIGQQYSFTPQCILVPTDTPITFRATSADMVHGFLITGTNDQSDAGAGLHLQLHGAFR